MLCTDKTGTMTAGTVVLDGALDLDGEPSPSVLRLAYLNAHFQAGFANPIDDAIVAGAGALAPAVAADGATRLDELPYDFTRKRLSVLVEEAGTTQIVTKGALQDVLAVCTHAQSGAELVDLATVRPRIEARYEALSGEGQRVLGIATREMSGSKALVADRRIRSRVRRLPDLPRSTQVRRRRDAPRAGGGRHLGPDDHRRQPPRGGPRRPMVGLDPAAMLTGPELEALDDGALALAAAPARIFAEVEPLAKERIIRALRASGQVVGYLGDGINDAPALHAADVGISVESAVDVAKEAAAIVLLDKDLRVLLDGVRQGRRTFANTMKYVFTTTSANFGNMLSMAVAAAVLHSCRCWRARSC